MFLEAKCDVKRQSLFPSALQVSTEIPKVSVSVNPGKYVCVFAMSLYACFAEREEERSFTSLKKYGLSNTLGFRKPAALFLPFSVSWVSRRWGRGTGNGPARKPCRVMPFPVFVSWYGHCCVTSVWLCFLPSQINSFYTVSARWYSGLCSFPSQITVFTVSARWYSVPIKSFCFLFIWFKL